MTKPSIGTKQSFLRHVFGVRRVPQHAAGNAIRQWTAFGETILELAAQFGLFGKAQRFPIFL